MTRLYNNARGPVMVVLIGGPDDGRIETMRSWCPEVRVPRRALSDVFGPVPDEVSIDDVHISVYRARRFVQPCGCVAIRYVHEGYRP